MVKLLDKEVPTPVVVGAALAAPLVLRAGSRLLSGPHKVVQNGRFKGAPLQPDVYDAVIVGAGPSGSTCAHFFCKARHSASRLRRRDMPSPQTARRFSAALLRLSRGPRGPRNNDTHAACFRGISGGPRLRAVSKSAGCSSCLIARLAAVDARCDSSGWRQGGAAGKGNISSRQVLRCARGYLKLRTGLTLNFVLARR